MEKLDSIATRYLEPGEVLHGTVPAFTGGGFGRLIIAITDRRLLMIKSSYSHFTDRGLLWADDISTVRISSQVVQTMGAGAGRNFKSGNSYVTLERADGGQVKLNIRRGFLFFPESDRHLKTLFTLVPGRA